MADKRHRTFVCIFPDFHNGPCHPAYKRVLPATKVMELVDDAICAAIDWTPLPGQPGRPKNGPLPAVNPKGPGTLATPQYFVLERCIREMEEVNARLDRLVSELTYKLQQKEK